MNKIVSFWLVIVSVTAGGQSNTAIPADVATSTVNATVTAQTIPQNISTSADTTGASFTSNRSLQIVAENSTTPSDNSSVPYS